MGHLLNSMIPSNGIDRGSIGLAFVYWRHWNGNHISKALGWICLDDGINQKGGAKRSEVF